MLLLPCVSRKVCDPAGDGGSAGSREEGFNSGWQYRQREVAEGVGFESREPADVGWRSQVDDTGGEHGSESDVDVQRDRVAGGCCLIRYPMVSTSEPSPVVSMEDAWLELLVKDDVDDGFVVVNVS